MAKLAMQRPAAMPFWPSRQASPDGEPAGWWQAAIYRPSRMLALLIYSYANGICSSHRIKHATHRDIGLGFVVANTHQDHDTMAVLRRNPQALPDDMGAARTQ